jgi:hypothetical protein
MRRGLPARPRLTDERSALAIADLPDRCKRAGKNSRSVCKRDVAAGEDERADLRRLEREALKAAVADALVARQHDPASRARKRKPGTIVGALRKVLGQALNGSARCRKRLSDRVAVERLVQEDG